MNGGKNDLNVLILSTSMLRRNTHWIIKLNNILFNLNSENVKLRNLKKYTPNLDDRKHSDECNIPYDELCKS